MQYVGLKFEVNFGHADPSEVVMGVISFPTMYRRQVGHTSPQPFVNGEAWNLSQQSWSLTVSTPLPQCVTMTNKMRNEVMPTPTKVKWTTKLLQISAYTRWPVLNQTLTLLNDSVASPFLVPLEGPGVEESGLSNHMAQT